MTYRRLLWLLVGLTLWLGCETNQTPLSVQGSQPPPDTLPRAGIDSVLFGYWVQAHMPSPDPESWWVTGFKIEPNGKMWRLGLEWATGRAAIDSFYTRDTILVARDGWLKWFQHNVLFEVTDSARYTVEEDTLILARPHRVDRYARWDGNTPLTPPIASWATAKVQGRPFQTNRVSERLPAFARVSAGGKGLFCELSEGFRCEFPEPRTIRLQVKNFHGPDRYALLGPDTTHATLVFWECDAAFEVSTTDSLPGELVITSFDTRTRRCEGTFRFTALHKDVVSNVIAQFPVEDGVFSLYVTGF